MTTRIGASLIGTSQWDANADTGSASGLGCDLQLRVEGACALAKVDHPLPLSPRLLDVEALAVIDDLEDDLPVLTPKEELDRVGPRMAHRVGNSFSRGRDDLRRP